MFSDFIGFIQDLYGTNDFIPLHAPCFTGNEKRYLRETIDSTFVSSVGEFVEKFEKKIAEYTGSEYAIATVNGTSALHAALKLGGVDQGDEVITQSLTFVATCNAIRYCGATPLFIDVDKKTLGLSPDSLKAFLTTHCEIRDDGACWNKTSNRRITACLPMHTFGFPAQLDELIRVCQKFNILLIEDAAESLGSFYKKKHTGTAGTLAILSFNGNKIITTGGGGIILTSDKLLAQRARHITTTAKIPHRWDFDHDEVGFNYRMPNLNAALGVAQLESLPDYLKSKRSIAHTYQRWGDEHGIQFVKEPVNSVANYWLNVVLTKNREQRDELLQQTHNMKVMTRPVWKPMHQLKINQDCYAVDMTNTEFLSNRLVNVPSSVRL